MASPRGRCGEHSKNQSSKSIFLQARDGERSFHSPRDLGQKYVIALARVESLCQTTRTIHPMTRSKTVASSRPRGDAAAPPVSLKFLAEHLGLSPATVSLVINRSPSAKSIPHRTQERIREAARQLNYRPNFMARSLRAQRSFTIGVVVPEISEGYAALVLSGIEDHLLEEGYFYFVVSHRHRADLIEEYPRLLQQRAVEGLIAVDTVCQKGVPIPVIAVSGHREVEGVTNIVLDHARAAKLAMEHLAQLGHRKIAFIKGQEFSSDTEIRWEAERAAAKELGLEINERLVGQLDGESPSPEVGYGVTRKVIAAETLLRRINAPAKTPYAKAITVEPELIVRESTAKVKP